MKEEIIQGLSDSVFEMEEERSAKLAHQVVEEGIDAFEAIDRGLSLGMQRAGDEFEKGTYFIPELLLCSDALNAGVDVLKPHIHVDGIVGEKIKVVIGVIEGDTHDIGKNLVKTMIDAGGFEVYDIGRDVPPQKFVDAALENNADIIAISTLMTTTMTGMQRVIDILNERGVRGNFKVIVGGGPISQNYANRIGADGYSPNAMEAVRLIRGLVGEKVASS
ncbi:MAG: corrinoid protein [Synergistaceae bacterium]|nr:corrinoid protein [Synergistaceae bacterium]